MNNTLTLQLPGDDDQYAAISTKQSILLIGANGSGKTRLGAWIELNSPQRASVHRISAQKSLAMPENVTPMSIDKAESTLLYGYADATGENAWQHKQGSRWNRKPAVALLNDYQQLLVYLFSDHTEESAKYLQASKATSDRVQPPVTKLERVKTVWEAILPHRELILGGLRIQVRVRDGQGVPYSASEMSDGERVIFYLIGQCLAAPGDGIIVIDEPELHLHKSVQVPLWKEIEALRRDCLFVYMTHDVDFATGMSDAKKIWLKSYDGRNWEWEVVQSIEELPESLLVEVLGSRKPVLFVEGQEGSDDVALYRAIFSKFLIVPSGSCTEVIQSVKALRDSDQLHHLEVLGLIDRDRRVDQEIIALRENCIFVLSVAEVENLFCTPEIIALVSEHLERDPDVDLTKVKAFVFSKLNSEIDTQIALRAAGEIKFQLAQFSEKVRDHEQLKDSIDSLLASIDVEAIYQDNESLLKTICDEEDYLELLRVYNRKSLAKQISPTLGLKDDGLAELVIRLANGSKQKEVAQCLQPYLGALADRAS